MKPATGEATLTVVTIVLIGTLFAVVLPLINTIANVIEERGLCIIEGGYWEEDINACKYPHNRY